MVLKARIVVPALLLAPLLKEATDSNTTRVLDIIPAIGDLELPEFNYSYNIGINSPFSIEGPL
jgi:hypothetical protein